jgi:ATP-dependent DNA helicase PIF1
MRLLRDSANLNPEKITKKNDYDVFIRSLGDSIAPNVPHSTYKNLVRIPADYETNGVEYLINFVFPELQDSSVLPDPEIFASRAILSPINKEVDEVNQIVKDKFPGEIVELCSADQVMRNSPNEYLGWNTSVLNSMRDSGIPPHVLQLNVGMPLVLLKNYDLKRGLSNGPSSLLLRTLMGE